MPYRKTPIAGARYAVVTFDKKGNENREDGSPFSEALLADMQREKPTDVFFFCHGWKGDFPASIEQYDKWIDASSALKNDHQRMGGGFRPFRIGLHWPSLPWGDEEIQGSAFDVGHDSGSFEDLIAKYADRLDLEGGGTGELEKVVAAHRKNAAAASLPGEAVDAYQKIATIIGRTSGEPGVAPDKEGEPFDAQRAFQAGNAVSAGAAFGGGDGILGGILGPLRQLSFWSMKKRARSVGENGMHDFVATLMKALPDARIHMMGHSFGCIVMSSILGGFGGSGSLPRRVDSLALVQGALSLWAYSGNIPMTKRPGYFAEVLRRKAVKGPIIVTRSMHDRAVGTCYPIACGMVMAGPEFAPDGEDADLPKYGAIGTFGIRGLADVETRMMGPSTEEYGFTNGKVYNLESSKYIAKGGGVSGAHSDISGPEVAHAIWEAALIR